jgi:hypothetical protein
MPDKTDIQAPFLSQPYIAMAAICIVLCVLAFSAHTHLRSQSLSVRASNDGLTPELQMSDTPSSWVASSVPRQVGLSKMTSMNEDSTGLRRRLRPKLTRLTEADYGQEEGDWLPLESPPSTEYLQHPVTLELAETSDYALAPYASTRSWHESWTTSGESPFEDNENTFIEPDGINESDFEEGEDTEER